MNVTDLVLIYFERSNALQWLWTLYVVILGGLLAFASMRKEKDVATTLLITVLFGIFAYKNLGGIRDITFQRFAVLEAIKQQTSQAAAAPGGRSLELLRPTLDPPAWDAARNTHIVSDLLTVAALWTMELRRRRASAAH